MSTPRVRLADVAQVNPRLTASNRPSPDATVSFVGMAAVSSETMSIVAAEDRPYADVRKGFTAFSRGDILLAKITPCFENGKFARSSDLPREHGFGSTEFHIVRPGDSVDDDYLFHLLRTPSVRNAGESRMKGAAGQRRVPAEYFVDLDIPLPSLPEQERIARILDAADALRDKRRESIAQLDALAQSTFLEMFGDPVSNPMEWKKERMGGLMRIGRGGSPRPIEKYLGGSINWIKIGDATRSEDDLYITQCAQKIVESGLPKTTLLEPGSFVFANSGVSLGFARILKVQGAIHDGWLAFDGYDEEKLSEIFLLKLLNCITEHFRRTAPAGTQPNLNTKIMKDFELILPPIELQRRFVSSVDALESQKFRLRAHLTELDTLFASLQSHAFAGEL